MNRRLAFAMLFASGLLLGQNQKKYSGPRPEKADMPYLLHASNLVATEVGEASEEKRKDEVANIVKGAASTARTPLAEPIFLLRSEKLSPDKVELYAMSVKNGNREVVIPTNPKKAKNAPKPLRLSMTRLEEGLYRLEANQWLDNGEYCLSPSGTQQVFCFQVY
ncbi:MAG: hypothetical protein JNN08_27465 [Bryobacterales bacterium]|nr:hypothetical protein [Bryobacterales bacterium]